jgi:hypothetical protein
MLKEEFDFFQVSTDGLLEEAEAASSAGKLGTQHTTYLYGW